MKGYVQREKGHRKLRMGRQSYAGSMYMVTTNTLYRYKVFKDEIYAEAAINAFTMPELLKDNRLICWALMPEHVHWIIQLGERDSISDVVRNMKSSSGRHVRRAGYQRTLWAAAFHERRLTNPIKIKIAIRYILNNPTKASIAIMGRAYTYCDPMHR